MSSSAVACVRHLISEYRRFLRTSYRFLDPSLREQFEKHLEGADVVVRGPYATLSREFELGARLASLVETGRAEPDLLRARWAFGAEPLYKHQEQAFETGRNGRSFVVTTGTGSGKTEAFLLPVFDGILRRKREGVTGVQAIFLYPMNALANDQVERLRRVLRGSGLDVSYYLYTGDSDVASQRLSEEPAETERLTRATARSHPPDILLTNYKQLEFLLVRAEDRGLFTPALRYLVLDEIHSYRGALATEIACLIRRLKTHARIEPGKLVGIGTSATVASEKGGGEALASFASALFGEDVAAGDVIGETLAPRPPVKHAWIPPVPHVTDGDLERVERDNDALVSLAERLTGRPVPEEGGIARRVGAVLDGNAIVGALEEIFSSPVALAGAVEMLRERLPQRAREPDEVLKREIEAYLLVGSAGDDNDPPRLRPKLHLFFHGVYDVSLCVNPACRALVPQGGTECLRCGSAARPAALCRTCGQDFVKVHFEREGDDLPVGTGDFYSDERSAFLTPRIHELPEGPGVDDEEPTEDESREPAEATRRNRMGEARLEAVGLCRGCGRIVGRGGSCPACNQPGLDYLIHRGSLHTCPACGDIYTRGDIVTPLRTGTASTVSTIATHHLDLLEGDDRKLLVFADNRQDVAHQAGYMADKHRGFALRHLVAFEVRKAGAAGKHLIELPEILYDEYLKLGIIRGRPTRPQRERWMDAITYEVANEFSRYARQRASLENLGLVGVEYEFLEELEEDDTFQRIAADAGIELSAATVLVRAILDVMRKNRAVALDFFQEFIDPNKKRRYRELEAEPYNIRFPDRDRSPKGFALNRPDHIRKSRSGSILGLYQENPKAGQLTATQKIAARVMGDRSRAERFLRAVVPILVRMELLIPVPNFPIPKADRTGKLQILQINPAVIRLVKPAAGFRCNACQTWRPYDLETCPTPKCRQGTLLPTSVDEDNYYVRLYTDRIPQRLAVTEHSAQVPGAERAERETFFKEGKIDALVCTPTLELGVDIGPLLTVALRNAPPTPANYVQRVGRAGRRLRIGFVSTFCAGGAHDRHAFEEPAWLVAGHFSPPTLRLDNPRIVRRHMRAFLLESVEAQLPRLMVEFLDDPRTPTRWNPEVLAGLVAEVRDRESDLAGVLAEVFEADRKAGRTQRFGKDESRELTRDFASDLTRVLESWWRRVQQLDREYREFATVGSPQSDQKKANARRRAYYEITQDPERAYTLNFLATQDLLPAYQFPVDTFSLDPGVVDTPTLYRPASIAIEEFAPGNFVYANGHKLRSIRVLFAGGLGATEFRAARSDAEATGRLRSFWFCERCGEAVGEARNSCPRCGAGLGEATECVFVDAFEAEESLRIGSDEESRQRQFHVRKESLLPASDRECRLYNYPCTPIEYWKLADIVVTNWGRADSKTSEGMRFWLCPDCGRHQPYDPGNSAHAQPLRKWQEYHRRLCPGEPAPLVLAYRFQADSLVLRFPSRQDERTIGRSTFSSSAVTLAEALLAGAGNLLELEPSELAAFPRPSADGGLTEEIVFYETVPGGAGYVEDVARRLPEVARAAQARLYGHECLRGCYLCLKHYRNQRWQPFFDKSGVRDLLMVLATMDPVEAETAATGASAQVLRRDLDARREELEKQGRLPGSKGPQSPIERSLLEALRAVPDLPEPESQHEIYDGSRLVTVPDFAYPDLKIAVFCDGFAFHGNPETLELDARKRNWLQSKEGGEWVVLTYWGRTIHRAADACASEIVAVYRQRLAAASGTGRIASASPPSESGAQPAGP
jgi:ATP-dependent helicase YprA (DUF1998 family)/rubrerythrin